MALAHAVHCLQVGIVATVLDTKALGVGLVQKYTWVPLCTESENIIDCSCMTHQPQSRRARMANSV